MANTNELVFGGTLGNRHLYVWKVTSDGTTQTLKSGLACVDAVWGQSSTDLAVTGMSFPSLASGTVTFGKNITSAKIWWIFCLGS